jgi:hypothetical protein
MPFRSISTLLFIYLGGGGEQYTHNLVEEWKKIANAPQKTDSSVSISRVRVCSADPALHGSLLAPGNVNSFVDALANHANILVLSELRAIPLHLYSWKDDPSLGALLSLRCCHLVDLFCVIKRTQVIESQ